MSVTLQDERLKLGQEASFLGCLGLALGLRVNSSGEAPNATNGLQISLANAMTQRTSNKGACPALAKWPSQAPTVGACALCP